MPQSTVLSPTQESPFPEGSIVHATPPNRLQVPRAASWCLGQGVNICRISQGLTSARAALALIPSGWIRAWERLLWGQVAVGKEEGAKSDGPKGET